MIFNRGRHGVQFFVDRFSLFHPFHELRVARKIREKFILAADRINELDSLPPSLPPSIDPRSFFPSFSASFQRFLSPPPVRLSNISYVDKLSQLIRGGSRVPRSKRADKRTFAADESRQILAPWNTIDRLQPLRLIAFEP